MDTDWLVLLDVSDFRPLLVDDEKLCDDDEVELLEVSDPPTLLLLDELCDDDDIDWLEDVVSEPPPLELDDVDDRLLDVLTDWELDDDVRLLCPLLVLLLNVWDELEVVLDDVSDPAALDVDDDVRLDEVLTD